MKRTLSEQYFSPESRRWKICLRLGMYLFLISLVCFVLAMFVYYPVRESSLFIPAGIVFVLGMLSIAPILMESDTIHRYYGTAFLLLYCAAVYIFLIFAVTSIGSTGAFKKTSNKGLNSTFASGAEPGVRPDLCPPRKCELT